MDSLLVPCARLLLVLLLLGTACAICSGSVIRVLCRREHDGDAYSGDDVEAVEAVEAAAVDGGWALVPTILAPGHLQNNTVT